MKLSKLKPNPDNPRTISDADLEKLKTSIEEFPKMLKLRPIIIDNKDVVLGGNMRLTALRELGFKEIPDDWVKYADELTAEEKKRFIIIDNVSFGEFNWDVLQTDWKLEALEGWGFDTEIFKTDGELVGFGRPAFNDADDDEELTGKPNKHWLYIEYYHFTEEQFNELSAKLTDYMDSEHQINPEKFIEIINFYETNKDGKS